MQKYNQQHIDVIMKQIEEYLLALLNRTPYSRFHWMGTDAIAELEEKFRKYYGCKFALTFSSATNALTAIALMLNLSEGDEVITTSLNWGSSIAGLLLFRKELKIRYTETGDDLNICPGHVRKLINSNTKAVWTCDYEDTPHDMFSIRQICDEFGLLYISDASQSFGKKINGKPASSLADIWVTSFGAGKSLSAGEGAVILTNDQICYNRMMLFQHPYRAKIELGLDQGSECYPVNGRLNPFSAIVANCLFNEILK